MITADALKVLTKLSAPALTQAIQQAGYKKDRFDSAKFLGLSNGGQFVYQVSYTEDGESVKTKVFASYNAERNTIVVDY